MAKLEIDCHRLTMLANHLEHGMPYGWAAEAVIRDYGVEVKITTPNGRMCLTGWTWLALSELTHFKCITDHVDWNVQEIQRLQERRAL